MNALITLSLIKSAVPSPHIYFLKTKISLFRVERDAVQSSSLRAFHTGAKGVLYIQCSQSIGQASAEICPRHHSATPHYQQNKHESDTQQLRVDTRTIDYFKDMFNHSIHDRYKQHLAVHTDISLLNHHLKRYECLQNGGVINAILLSD